MDLSEPRYATASLSAGHPPTLLVGCWVWGVRYGVGCVRCEGLLLLASYASAGAQFVTVFAS